MFSVLDTLAVTNSVTLAMADLKLSAIFLAAVSMLPSRVRVIPRYLNSVTSTRSVPLYVKVGIAELPLLKKTMTFVLSVLSLSPLKRVEIVQLELQIFSRV